MTRFELAVCPGARRRVVPAALRHARTAPGIRLQIGWNNREQRCPLAGIYLLTLCHNSGCLIDSINLPVYLGVKEDCRHTRAGGSRPASLSPCLSSVRHVRYIRDRYERRVQSFLLADSFLRS